MATELHCEALALDGGSANGVRLNARNGEHELTGESVDHLNHALKERRLRRPEQRLRELVAPVAQAVTSEINEWLAEDPRARTVEIEARLTGCKFNCEFTHYKCVSDGIESRWAKQDEWKGDDESNATARVAFVARQLTNGPDGKTALAQLEADLLSFVTSVDIPWKRKRIAE